MLVNKRDEDYVPNDKFLSFPVERKVSIILEFMYDRFMIILLRCFSQIKFSPISMNPNYDFRDSFVKLT